MGAKTHFAELSVLTTEQMDVLDITEEVAAAVRASGLREGLALVAVAGSTASIATIEAEPGAVADLKRAVQAIAPSDADYARDRRWGDGNGPAQVASALLGTSRSFAVHRGELVLGPWQQIVLVDFDNKPRRRGVHVQLVGR